MNRLTAASAFTAAVLAAAGAWAYHDYAWHRHQSELARNWRSSASVQSGRDVRNGDFELVDPQRAIVETISRVKLVVDPELRVERMRVGTGRWNDEREKGVVDYEADEYRQASAQFLPDGAFAVFVESADIGHSEWYELVVPPDAVSGQVLAGKSQMFIDIAPCYSQPLWVEGVLTLSGLPAKAGERVNLDLRVNVADGWAFHAQADLTSRPGAGCSTGREKLCAPRWQATPFAGIVEPRARWRIWAQVKPDATRLS